MTYCRLNNKGWFLVAVACLFLIVHYFPSESIDRLVGNPVSVIGLLDNCIALAEQAGQMIVSQSNSSLNKQIKKPSDDNKAHGTPNEVLTDLDLLSQHLITKRLGTLYPNLKIRSEENNSTLPASRSAILSEYLKSLPARSANRHSTRLPSHDFLLSSSDLAIWLDPLDATQELTEGLTEYVTVMLCVAWRGFPIAGVIHQPFLDRTYWSWQDAMSSDLSEAVSQRLHRSTATTSDTSNLTSSSLRLTHSRSHLIDKSSDLANKLKTLSSSSPDQPAFTVVPAGGSGYKIISLIRGDADLYIHPANIRLFDVCAGHALLKATGGHLAGIDSSRLFYPPEGEVMIEGGLFGASTQLLYDAWADRFRSLFGAT